ncbi:hypothetical protein J6590_023333 [Homalodisca vitripennis]|nr:hypothetical protein J6590_023333 [Homalodisca vitripennis]
MKELLLAARSFGKIGEVRAKKPSLTQPGDQWLKGNFLTTTWPGKWAACKNRIA